MTKRILAAVVILTCCRAAGAQSDTEGILKNIADLGARSVVAVQVTAEDETGAGSSTAMGVCVDSKGVFLTQAIDVRTTLEAIKSIELLPPGSSTKSTPAKLLGVDSATELAFVQATEPGDWTAVQFVPGADLAIGQRVFSAGLMITKESRPLCVGLGYISSKMRMPETLLSVTGGKLTGVGSPVFTADGKAVGLVGNQMFLTYRMATTGGTVRAMLEGRQETSFFTEADEFVYVLQNIPTDGQVRRLPWMGVGQLEAIQPEYAAILGLQRPGVMLEQIIPGHPADKAGLQSRDIVLEVNGQGIEDMGAPEMTVRAFSRSISRMQIGQTVALTIMRGTETKTVNVTLGATPQLPGEANRYYCRPLGLLVREKVPIDQYIDRSSSGTRPGVLVVNMAPNSPAAAQLQSGDLIARVNGQAVTTVDHLRQIIENALVADPSAPVSLSIWRGSQTLEVKIRAPSR